MQTNQIKEERTKMNGKINKRKKMDNHTPICFIINQLKRPTK